MLSICRACQQILFWYFSLQNTFDVMRPWKVTFFVNSEAQAKLKDDDDEPDDFYWTDDGRPPQLPRPESAGWLE